MSKIIIYNESDLNDWLIAELVGRLLVKDEILNGKQCAITFKCGVDCWFERLKSGTLKFTFYEHKEEDV